MNWWRFDFCLGEECRSRLCDWEWNMYPQSSPSVSAQQVVVLFFFPPRKCSSNPSKMDVKGVFMSWLSNHNKESDKFSGSIAASWSQAIPLDTFVISWFPIRQYHTCIYQNILKYIICTVCTCAVHTLFYCSFYVLLLHSHSHRHRITKTSPLTGKPSAMLDTVEGERGKRWILYWNRSDITVFGVNILL